MKAAGNLPRVAFKLLQMALLSLGVGEAKAFGAAVRWGRADLAEVCCCSDSVLSGEVERLGGRTLRYSHWNGFDLSTDKGYEACAASLRAERPRLTWFAPPCAMDSQLHHLNDCQFGDDPAYLKKKKEKMRRSIRIRPYYLMHIITDINDSLVAIKGPTGENLNSEPLKFLMSGNPKSVV